MAAVAVGDALRRPDRGYAVLALIDELLAIKPEPCVEPGREEAKPLDSVVSAVTK